MSQCRVYEQILHKYHEVSAKISVGYSLESKVSLLYISIDLGGVGSWLTVFGWCILQCSI